MLPARSNVHRAGHIDGCGCVCQVGKARPYFVIWYLPGFLHDRRSQTSCLSMIRAKTSSRQGNMRFEICGGSWRGSVGHSRSRGRSSLFLCNSAMNRDKSESALLTLIVSERTHTFTVLSPRANMVRKRTRRNFFEDSFRLVASAPNSSVTKNTHFQSSVSPVCIYGTTTLPIAY